MEFYELLRKSCDETIVARCQHTANHHSSVNELDKMIERDPHIQLLRMRCKLRRELKNEWGLTKFHHQMQMNSSSATATTTTVGSSASTTSKTLIPAKSSVWTSNSNGEEHGGADGAREKNKMQMDGARVMSELDNPNNLINSDDDEDNDDNDDNSNRRSLQHRKQMSSVKHSDGNSVDMVGSNNTSSSDNSNQTENNSTVQQQQRKQLMMKRNEPHRMSQNNTLSQSISILNSMRRQETDRQQDDFMLVPLNDIQVHLDRCVLDAHTSGGLNTNQINNFLKNSMYHVHDR